MKSYTHYHQALSHARELATTCARDVGILKAQEFYLTVYLVFLLPAPEHRTGRELICEIVEPNTPQTLS